MTQYNDILFMFRVIFYIQVANLALALLLLLRVRGVRHSITKWALNMKYGSIAAGPMQMGGRLQTGDFTKEKK